MVVEGYRILYTKEEIDGMVESLSKSICSCFEGGSLSSVVFIGILDACVWFFSDLTRAFCGIGLEDQFEVGFVSGKSYNGTVKEGLAQVDLVTRFPAEGLDGKRVMLVDTILQTGDTLVQASKALRKYGVYSVGYTALLVHSAESRVCGFMSHFDGPCFYAQLLPKDTAYLVGYGLDLDRRYRGMPDILEIGQGGGDDSV